MTVLKGKSVCAGIVKGPLLVFRTGGSEKISSSSVLSPEEELARLLYDYASHSATSDYDIVREFAGNWLSVYRTTLYPVDEADGTWQRVAFSSCPGDGGFNVIRLQPEAWQERVSVSFRELPEGSPLAPNDPGECRCGEDGGTVDKQVSQYNAKPSGSANSTDEESTRPEYAEEDTICDHRYGFVAHLSDGSRVYSEMYSAPEDTVSFSIPENTRRLYFIVAGTPHKHFPHKWDNIEINDRQLPYEIRIE